MCLCAKDMLKPRRCAPSDGAPPASTVWVYFLWAQALRNTLPGIADRGWAQHRTPRNCCSCVTEAGGRMALSKSPGAASISLLAPFLIFRPVYCTILSNALACCSVVLSIFLGCCPKINSSVLCWDTVFINLFL